MKNTTKLTKSLIGNAQGLNIGCVIALIFAFNEFDLDAVYIVLLIVFAVLLLLPVLILHWAKKSLSEADQSVEETNEDNTPGNNCKLGKIIIIFLLIFPFYQSQGQNNPALIAEKKENIARTTSKNVSEALIYSSKCGDSVPITVPCLKRLKVEYLIPIDTLLSQYISLGEVSPKFFTPSSYSSNITDAEATRLQLYLEISIEELDSYIKSPTKTNLFVFHTVFLSFGEAFLKEMKE